MSQANPPPYLPWSTSSADRTLFHIYTFNPSQKHHSIRTLSPLGSSGARGKFKDALNLPTKYMAVSGNGDLIQYLMIIKSRLLLGAVPNFEALPYTPDDHCFRMLNSLRCHSAQRDRRNCEGWKVSPIVSFGDTPLYRIINHSIVNQHESWINTGLIIHQPEEFVSILPNNFQWHRDGHNGIYPNELGIQSYPGLDCHMPCSPSW